MQLLLKASTLLLLTEGDRRRARIELAVARTSGAAVPDSKPGDPVDMESWRARFSG